MEKKTIGRLIAALRKANGMTQKELGEKLFVSDKTVSRWECDESTPELSLIPAIAEIFGITTDELLRGERNSPGNSGSEEASERQKGRRDKQFRLMLCRQHKKYQNLTLVSVGISILGLFAAMIANLAFSEGLIAFCLAGAFVAISEICQICFAINANLPTDEEDDIYNGQIQEANQKIYQTAVKVSFVNIGLLAFCLPLVTLINGANYGLTFAYWLGYGLLFMLVGVVISYILYLLWFQKLLERRGTVSFSDKEEARQKRSRRLLLRTLVVSGSVALVIGLMILVLNILNQNGVFLKKETFTTCEEFKTYMEDEYDRWYEQWSRGQYSYTDADGNAIVDLPVVVIPGDGEEPAENDHPFREYEQITNASGEVICEFYYNPDLFERIVYTETSADQMPVTVVTRQAYYNARLLFRLIEAALYLLIILDLAVAAVVYLVKVRRFVSRRKETS